MSVERAARLRIQVLFIAIALAAGGSCVTASAESSAATPATEDGAVAGGFARVANVTLTPLGSDGAVLEVLGTSAFTPDLFQMEGPHRVVLDLVGADGAVPLSWSSATGLVRKARWGTRERDGRPVVRYVVETSARAHCRLVHDGARVRVEITAAEQPQAQAQPQTQAQPQAPAQPRTQAQAQPQTQAPAQPQTQAALHAQVQTNARTQKAARRLSERRAAKGINWSWLTASRPMPLAAKAHKRTTPAGRQGTPPRTQPGTSSFAQSTAAASMHPRSLSTAGSAPPPSAQTAAPPRVPVAELATDPAGMRVAGLVSGADAAERLLAPSQASDANSAPASATTAGALAQASTRLTAREPLPHREAEPLPTFSLDVQAAEIHGVLRSIAEYADLNIVADNNVAGSVTMRAIDLNWRDMLDAVCQASGLTYDENGAIIRIATVKTAREEALAQESAARKQEEYMPLMTKVVLVNYANAKELQETLSKSTSPRGHVEVDPRTNAVILTDIAPRLEELETMVRSLDSETIQVEIAAKIMDVDEFAARQLGIRWTADDLHSSSANASGSVSVKADDILDPVGDVRIGVIRSFGEIDAKLQALEQSNEAEIISAPHITTVSNRMARILVGKEVPLITLDYAGNAITELKKVGITLEVTPHVNTEGLITMDIHPEVSDLSSQATAQGGVVFTTTEADTRVLVENGQTAVIGGLIRTSEIEYQRGVPVLSKIPVLGHLFKSSDKRSEKREMLIFITPTLVNGAPSF
ncbi:MAG: type IV pilus secretin PilQ [Candidatus Eisenbacteria bacterium]|nr:type IV pilus secretin PilQ [Candidatus Eisenbacteria bacterium]